MHALNTIYSSSPVSYGESASLAIDAYARAYVESVYEEAYETHLKEGRNQSHHEAEDKAEVAASLGYDSAYKTISDDANFILRGGSFWELADIPLWEQRGQPIHVRYAWEDLSQKLITLNQDWDVWIKWYEDRVDGKGISEELEFARLSFPTEDYKNPAVLNPKIKALEDEFSLNELTQNDAVETVEINESGKVDLSTESYGRHLQNTPEQGDLYEEYRSAVTELKSLSTNQLAGISSPTSRLYEVLPKNPATALVARIWARTNRLRISLARHDIALRNKIDPIEGAPQGVLDPVAADLLRQVIHTFNNLAIGDDGLRAKEEGAAGPQEESTIDAANEILRPVLSDVLTESLASEEAAELFEEILNQNEIMGRDKPGLTVENLQKIENHKRQNNFVAAIIKRARKVEDGFWSGMGKALGAVVIAGSAALIAYVQTVWPSLAGAVGRIFEALAKSIGI